MTDETTDTLSERERAILDLLSNPTPLCNYLRRLPVYEDPDERPSCGFGCHDEPECITCGPWPIEEFPDIAEAVDVMLVGEFLDWARIDTDHPAIAWWKEHTGEDLR